MADALMDGTKITNLAFEGCSFSAGQCAAIMATGLSRNTSLISINVHCNNARVLIDALAATFPSITTLRRLELSRQDNDDGYCGLSAILLTLGKNTGLKSLKVDCFDSTDESLCSAIKNGLEMNETLESLELYCVPLLDESAASWCRALSFLCTNKTLKSLTLNLKGGATRSCVSAFWSHIAVMLQENASLESVCIPTWLSYKIKTEEYFDFVTALQHNRTLKSLNFKTVGSLQLTNDECKQMASILKKNFTLKSLRCGRHLATEWSRTWVSGSRRILHLERCRSAECCKQRYQLRVLAPVGKSETVRPTRRGGCK
jgi:hypothetical protein